MVAAARVAGGTPRRAARSRLREMADVRSGRARDSCSSPTARRRLPPARRAARPAQPRLHRSRERPQGRRASRDARRARAPGPAPAAAGSHCDRTPARSGGQQRPAGPAVRAARAAAAAGWWRRSAAAAEADHMLIGEIISVAIGALRANKLRSLLTMLGIVIGVGAVIAVVALGTGAQQAVKDRISALGTTLLTVNPGQQRGGRRWRRHRRRTAATDDRRCESGRRTRHDIFSRSSPRCARSSRSCSATRTPARRSSAPRRTTSRFASTASRPGRMFTAARRRRPPARRRGRLGSGRESRHHHARGADRRERAHSRHRSSP